MAPLLLEFLLCQNIAYLIVDNIKPPVVPTLSGKEGMKILEITDFCDFVIPGFPILVSTLRIEIAKLVPLYPLFVAGEPKHVFSGGFLGV